MGMFKLVIGGLVAYVDRKSASGRKYISVLMPTGPRPQHSSDLSILLGHHPFLRFNSKYLHAESTRKPNFSVAPFGVDGKDYILFLGKEVLSLKGADSSVEKI